MTASMLTRADAIRWWMTHDPPPLWTNVTRYVSRKRRSELTGDPESDYSSIPEATGVPQPQLLQAGDRTFRQSCPSRIDIPSQTNALQEYWYQFSHWHVLQGYPPTLQKIKNTWAPPGGPPPLAPEVEMVESGVITMAVYNYSGGPREGDTPAVFVLIGDEDFQLIPGKFSDYITVKSLDPAVQPVVIDDEMVLTGAPMELTAKEQVGLYEFSHWHQEGALMSVRLPFVRRNVLKLDKDAGGTWWAVYSRLDRIRDPEIPHSYDPWWWLNGPLASSRADLQFNAASTMARLANVVSPELRAAMREIAEKQAVAAAESFRKDLGANGAREG